MNGGREKTGIELPEEETRLLLFWREGFVRESYCFLTGRWAGWIDGWMAGWLNG